MDFNRNFDHIPQTSLVLLSFLNQKDCQNSEPRRVFDYCEERFSLSTNHIDSDGDVEADGHSPPATYRDLLHELQHNVQPHLSVNAEEAQAAREMAAELIRIADLLEQSVLSQAAESLTKKLRSSKKEVWAGHLSKGVQTLLQHVAAATEFKKELVEMAFTFMLMKTVCERTPDFLFSLYGTVVQFFGSN